MQWSPHKKEIARNMQLRLKKDHSPVITKLISRRELFALLAKSERDILRELEMINPKQYGFRGTYYGIREPQNSKLKSVPQAYTEGGQYVPVSVHKDLMRMLRTMQSELGSKVVVISAYRSPAYQTLLFLEILIENNFNMRKTCRRVAIPGWSEHGVPNNQAVDFDVESAKGEKKPSFGSTAQYRWLKANASHYHFYLSYPRNNQDGVMFEPWHWHWEAKS